MLISTPRARHRRADVFPDSTGPYDVTDEPGRHRVSQHALPYEPLGSTVDPISKARCNGGMKNAYGKVLRHCRRASCPVHSPGGYAEYAAKHRRGLSFMEWA